MQTQQICQAASCCPCSGRIYLPCPNTTSCIAKTHVNRHKRATVVYVQTGNSSCPAGLQLHKVAFTAVTAHRFDCHLLPCSFAAAVAVHIEHVECSYNCCVAAWIEGAAAEVVCFRVTTVVKRLQLSAVMIIKHHLWQSNNASHASRSMMIIVFYWSITTHWRLQLQADATVVI
eukprot:GHUV01046774.1.p1 GENE.GHUV01046774.1~~GHUV01046774.1.p1  ORF type:complete len:174 (+),score=14.32 GHUV01046774.1:83-604(+)